MNNPPLNYLKIISPDEAVHVYNLGCARNLVDAQEIIAKLKAAGNTCVALNDADTVIVNTCSFVEDAKRESVEAILDLIDMKKSGAIKKLIVTGCMAQRYRTELGKEFAEVDAFGGVLALAEKPAENEDPLTPAHTRYVKICEGCFNHCRFCIIPRIKGNLKSRQVESIIDEVKGFDTGVVKEINIIGQDITAYGCDIYDEKKLADLITQLASAVQGIAWIRLLYLFPAHVTDALIDVIAKEPKVCRYIDVPLQHINDRILKDMGRGITTAGTRALLDKLRARIDGIALRSSFIVGLPGETDAEFEELCRFFEEVQFDRAGVFIYSQEEGTPAFDMAHQVEEKIKRQRYDHLMQLQMDISQNLLKNYIGRQMRILIEEKQDVAERVFIGRSEFDAPEVDGLVYVHSDVDLPIGEFVDVRMTDTSEYDLIGEAA